MQRFGHLDNLNEDMSPYSSPIMLTARKNSSLKKIIADFRFLNTRILRGNFAFPFIRDTSAILVSCKCGHSSVPDLKDAYYRIKLSNSS